MHHLQQPAAPCLQAFLLTLSPRHAPLSTTTDASGYGAGGYSAGYGGGADPGLQPGQTIKPGDWKCGSCGNVK